MVSQTSITPVGPGSAVSVAAEPFRDGVSADPVLCLLPGDPSLDPVLGDGVVDRQLPALAGIGKPVDPRIAEVRHENLGAVDHGPGEGC